MKAAFQFKHLLQPLSSLTKAMKKVGYPWMIIGGMASTLLGKPMFTADIDISLGVLPFEKKAIKKSRRNKIGNVSFNLPLPEDLIVLKAVTHRPVDIIDIQEIVKSNPKIDINYIKQTTSEFAKALEMPEIWGDIKNIIIKKKRGTRNPKT